MIKFTSKGQAYVSRNTQSDIPIYTAHRSIKSTSTRDIHIKKSSISSSERISIFSGLHTIEQFYGKGIKSYFSFVNYMILFNLLLSALGFISFIMFMSDPNKHYSFKWDDFFISNYIYKSSDKYWIGTTCASLVCLLLMGPIYYFAEKYIINKNRMVPTIENIWEFVDNENIEMTFDDTIADNTYKQTGYIISMSITFLCVSLSACILAGLIEAQKFVIVTYGDIILFSIVSLNSIMNLPICIAFMLINIVWKYMSYYVTNLENNKNWTQYNISQSSKLILFKIVSATMLYTLMAIILKPISSCLETTIGTNFMYIVVIDAVVINFFVEICIPLCMRKFRQKCLKKTNERLPEFNISEELQQLIYRQFIINIGFIICPLISAVGLIGMLLQFMFDRIKLKYVCADPGHVERPLEKFLLVLCLFLTASTLFTFPNGGLWMIFIPDMLPSGLKNCSMTGALYR